MTVAPQARARACELSSLLVPARETPCQICREAVQHIGCSYANLHRLLVEPKLVLIVLQQAYMDTQSSPKFHWCQT